MDTNSKRLNLATVVAAVALFVALGAAVSIGPARIPVSKILGELISKVPGVGYRSLLNPRESATIWQIRLPRAVAGMIVGAVLSAAGASYQGAFRNPLADPYLLGVAAGAGLGATLAIVARSAAATGSDAGLSLGTSSLSTVPVAAFVCALATVALTYSVAGGHKANATALLLSGVAVTSFLTAAQTYVLQQHTDVLREVYSWILGRLTVVGWHDIKLVLPYACIAIVTMLAMAPRLDVMAVGDEEAQSLGVKVRQTRAIVIVAASLGTAAAVAISGLIGFVGIIVPHIIRLLVGGSYRRILPLSVLVGGAFLVVADLAARTLVSPQEVPIGVLTAFIGGPFFLLVLRSKASARFSGSTSASDSGSRRHSNGGQ